MGEQPTSETNTDSQTPAPEVLQPQTGGANSEGSGQPAAPLPDKPKNPPATPKRGAYKPSHRATAIGAGVILFILIVNAAIVAFVFRSQDDSGLFSNREDVIISTEVLDQLGVSKTPVGNLGTRLIVGPDSRFNGKVEVAGDVSVGGKLTINNAFQASSASFSKLEAGEVALTQLNVNNDATISSLSLRNDLGVVGQTRLQGPVTISQLLTVNNNVTISGGLTVGGAFSTNALQAGDVTAGTILRLGGRIITQGAAPGVSAGGAVGSSGTVSISGNNIAGTVAVNVGTGAVGGTLASITFASPYSGTPHVVITPVGGPVGSFYINRSSSGFSIHVSSGLAPGGYAFDYIVMQ